MMMMMMIIIIIIIIIISKTEAIFALYSMSFVFHFYSFIGFYVCCTKISSQFEIISKLPAVKSCAYSSALPGTELEGSVEPINGAAWGRTICETR